MAFDNCYGVRVSRPYLRADNVYGEYGEDAQRAILRNGEAEPIWRVDYS